MEPKGTFRDAETGVLLLQHRRTRRQEGTEEHVGTKKTLVKQEVGL